MGSVADTEKKVAETVKIEAETDKVVKETAMMGVTNGEA